MFCFRWYKRWNILLIWECPGPKTRIVLYMWRDWKIPSVCQFTIVIRQILLFFPQTSLLLWEKTITDITCLVLESSHAVIIGGSVIVTAWHCHWTGTSSVFNHPFQHRKFHLLLMILHLSSSTLHESRKKSPPSIPKPQSMVIENRQNHWHYFASLFLALIENEEEAPKRDTKKPPRKQKTTQKGWKGELDTAAQFTTTHVVRQATNHLSKILLTISGVGSLSSIYTAYIKVKKISGSRTQSASPAYIKAKKTSGSWAQSVSASKESRRFRRNQKWVERQRRSSTITLEKSV